MYEIFQFLLLAFGQLINALAWHKVKCLLWAALLSVCLCLSQCVRLFVRINAISMNVFCVRHPGWVSLNECRYCVSELWVLHCVQWGHILCVWSVSKEGQSALAWTSRMAKGHLTVLTEKKEHVQLLQIYHWAPVFILSHGERLRQPEGLSLYPLILFHTFYFTINCFGLWELSCQLVCSSVKYAISNNSA